MYQVNKSDKQAKQALQNAINSVPTKNLLEPKSEHSRAPSPIRRQNQRWTSARNDSHSRARYAKNKPKSTIPHKQTSDDSFVKVGTEQANSENHTQYFSVTATEGENLVDSEGLVDIDAIENEAVTQLKSIRQATKEAIQLLKNPPEDQTPKEYIEWSQSIIQKPNIKQAVVRRFIANHLNQRGEFIENEDDDTDYIKAKIFKPVKLNKEFKLPQRNELITTGKLEGLATARSVIRDHINGPYMSVGCTMYHDGCKAGQEDMRRAEIVQVLSPILWAYDKRCNCCAGKKQSKQCIFSLPKEVSGFAPTLTYQQLLERLKLGSKILRDLDLVIELESDNTGKLIYGTFFVRHELVEAFVELSEADGYKTLCNQVSLIRNEGYSFSELKEWNSNRQMIDIKTTTRKEFLKIQHNNVLFIETMRAKLTKFKYKHLIHWRENARLVPTHVADWNLVQRKAYRSRLKANLGDGLFNPESIGVGPVQFNGTGVMLGGNITVQSAKARFKLQLAAIYIALDIVTSDALIGKALDKSCYEVIDLQFVKKKDKLHVVKTEILNTSCKNLRFFYPTDKTSQIEPGRYKTLSYKLQKNLDQLVKITEHCTPLDMLHSLCGVSDRTITIDQYLGTYDVLRINRIEESQVYKEITGSVVGVDHAHEVVLKMAIAFILGLEWVYYNILLSYSSKLEVFKDEVIANSIHSYNSSDDDSSDIPNMDSIDSNDNDPIHENNNDEHDDQGGDPEDPIPEMYPINPEEFNVGIDRAFTTMKIKVDWQIVKSDVTYDDADETESSFSVAQHCEARYDRNETTAVSSLLTNQPVIHDYVTPVNEDLQAAYRNIRQLWSSPGIYERNVKIRCHLDSIYALMVNEPKSMRGTGAYPNQYIYNIAASIQRILDKDGRGSIVLEAYKMFQLDHFVYQVHRRRMYMRDRAGTNDAAVNAGGAFARVCYYPDNMHQQRILVVPAWLILVSQGTAAEWAEACTAAGVTADAPTRLTILNALQGNALPGFAGNVRITLPTGTTGRDVLTTIMGGYRVNGCWLAAGNLNQRFGMDELMECYCRTNNGQIVLANQDMTGYSVIISPLSDMQQIRAMMVEFGALTANQLPQLAIPGFAEHWYQWAGQVQFLLDMDQMDDRLGMTRPMFSTAGAPISQIIQEVLNRTAFALHGYTNTDPNTQIGALPAGVQVSQTWASGNPLWQQPLLSFNRTAVGVALNLFTYWNTDTFTLEEYHDDVKQSYLNEQGFDLQVGMNYVYSPSWNFAHNTLRKFKELMKIGGGLLPNDLFPSLNQVPRSNNDERFMAWQLPMNYNHNSIVCRFYPTLSAPLLARTTLQGRPLTAKGPLDEVFVGSILGLTSDEIKTIYDQQMQVFLSTAANNGGASYYNPVMQTAEQTAAKYSCRIWQSSSLQLMMLFIADEAQIQIVNRNAVDREFVLRTVTFQRGVLAGASEQPRFMSVGQHMIMPDVAANSQPFYELVTPNFVPPANNLYNQPLCGCVGMYLGQSVFFHWRNYIDKSKPFRVDNPILSSINSKPSGGDENDIRENLDADE